MEIYQYYLLIDMHRECYKYEELYENIHIYYHEEHEYDNGFVVFRIAPRTSAAEDLNEVRKLVKDFGFATCIHEYPIFW